MSQPDERCIRIKADTYEKLHKLKHKGFHRSIDYLLKEMIKNHRKR